MPAPGYGAYVAPDKYAQMGWVLGLGGRSAEDRRARLFSRVDELLHAVAMPRSLAETGIAHEDFEKALPGLVRAAFADPSLRTNPRMPLLTELAALLRAAYQGRPD